MMNIIPEEVHPISEEVLEVGGAYHLIEIMVQKGKPISILTAIEVIEVTFIGGIEAGDLGGHFKTISSLVTIVQGIMDIMHIMQEGIKGVVETIQERR